MESDGIEESFDGLLRAAVTAGAQLGEKLSRLNEQLSRDEEARSRQESRELQARFEAERQSAMGELQVVHREDWWTKAGPEDIGGTYATAQAWREFDPAAAQAGDRIKDELRMRYGLDVNHLDADPARVQEQLARMEAERNEALSSEERRKETQERTEADELMRDADRMDRNAEQAPEAASTELDPMERGAGFHDGEATKSSSADLQHDADQFYDSAERRAGTATELENKGIDQRTVQTRMRADVSQGKPATAAVRQEKSVKARKGRSRVGASKQATLDR